MYDVRRSDKVKHSLGRLKKVRQFNTSFGIILFKRIMVMEFWIQNRQHFANKQKTLNSNFKS